MRRPLLFTVGTAVALAVSCLLPVGATRAPATKAPPRVFTTGFEKISDFSGMYISPPTASTQHGLVGSPRHKGKLAHCGTITGPGTIADVDGPNHRGYPTEQLYKLAPGGGFPTPAVIKVWVWADVAMVPGQWFSLATLSADASNQWTRLVTVNLDPGGWINVFHVPDQGAHVPEIETHRPFPMRTWVQLKIRIDFAAQHGSIAVYQNGALVARAAVRGGHGTLEQAHFGLYAISSLTAGTVCNDDLKITSARA
jgi:hypothetical protein